MKKLSIICGCCCLLLVAGCGSYTESRGVSLAGPVKTVALGEFTGSDPASMKFFKDTVEKEFASAGFLVVTTKSDVVITGIIYYSHIEPMIASLTAKTSSGQMINYIDLVSSKATRFDPKTPMDAAKELTKRLIKQMNAR